MCRENGISSHFSNIIGFPQDTEQAIGEHLEVLCEMAPTWASFYILCPIPGTEQYDEFLADGLITEKNLDRFDTTCLTWRHPSFSRERLSELLFMCYRQFYLAAARAAQCMGRDAVPQRRDASEVRGEWRMSLFTRYCAWRRTHPMSGGVMRVRRDGVDDFLALRKSAFGTELAPLPRSLQLPAAESQPNQAVARAAAQ